MENKGIPKGQEHVFDFTSRCIHALGSYSWSQSCFTLCYLALTGATVLHKEPHKLIYFAKLDSLESLIGLPMLFCFPRVSLSLVTKHSTLTPCHCQYRQMFPGPLCLGDSR